MGAYAHQAFPVLQLHYWSVYFLFKLMAFHNRSREISKSPKPASRRFGHPTMSRPSKILIFISLKHSTPPIHSMSSNPTIHPQFRTKVVCKLSCRHCTSTVSLRGMRAILLGDTKVKSITRSKRRDWFSCVINKGWTVLYGCITKQVKIFDVADVVAPIAFLKMGATECISKKGYWSDIWQCTTRWKGLHDE